ncbi:putative glycogenin glucosyltransferase [Diplonema papillatum]|nr:putative glycogenin glucosyltransferase [Diplonema papillatum]
MRHGAKKHRLVLVGVLAVSAAVLSTVGTAQWDGGGGGGGDASHIHSSPASQAPLPPPTTRAESAESRQLQQQQQQHLPDPTSTCSEREYTAQPGREGDWACSESAPGSGAPVQFETGFSSLPAACGIDARSPVARLESLHHGVYSVTTASGARFVVKPECRPAAKWHGQQGWPEIAAFRLSLLAFSPASPGSVPCAKGVVLTVPATFRATIHSDGCGVTEDVGGKGDGFFFTLRGVASSWVHHDDDAVGRLGGAFDAVFFAGESLPEASSRAGEEVRGWGLDVSDVVILDYLLLNPDREDKNWFFDRPEQQQRQQQQQRPKKRRVLMMDNGWGFAGAGYTDSVCSAGLQLLRPPPAARWRRKQRKKENKKKEGGEAEFCRFRASTVARLRALLPAWRASLGRAWADGLRADAGVAWLTRSFAHWEATAPKHAKPANGLYSVALGRFFQGCPAAPGTPQGAEGKVSGGQKLVLRPAGAAAAAAAAAEEKEGDNGWDFAGAGYTDSVCSAGLQLLRPPPAARWRRKQRKKENKKKEGGEAEFCRFRASTVARLRALLPAWRASLGRAWADGLRADAGVAWLTRSFAHWEATAPKHAKPANGLYSVALGRFFQGEDKSWFFDRPEQQQQQQQRPKKRRVTTGGTSLVPGTQTASARRGSSCFDRRRPPWRRKQRKKENKKKEGGEAEFCRFRASTVARLRALLPAWRASLGRAWADGLRADAGVAWLTRSFAHWEATAPKHAKPANGLYSVALGRFFQGEDKSWFFDRPEQQQQQQQRPKKRRVTTGGTSLVPGTQTASARRGSSCFDRRRPPWRRKQRKKENKKKEGGEAEFCRFRASTVARLRALLPAWRASLGRAWADGLRADAGVAWLTRSFAHWEATAPKHAKPANGLYSVALGRFFQGCPAAPGTPQGADGKGGQKLVLRPAGAAAAAAAAAEEKEGDNGWDFAGAGYTDSVCSAGLQLLRPPPAARWRRKQRKKENKKKEGGEAEFCRFRASTVARLRALLPAWRASLGRAWADGLRADAGVAWLTRSFAHWEATAPKHAKPANGLYSVALGRFFQGCPAAPGTPQGAEGKVSGGQKLVLRPAGAAAAAAAAAEEKEGGNGWDFAGAGYTDSVCSAGLQLLRPPPAARWRRKQRKKENKKKEGGEAEFCRFRASTVARLRALLPAWRASLGRAWADGLRADAGVAWLTRSFAHWEATAPKHAKPANGLYSVALGRFFQGCPAAPGTPQGAEGKVSVEQQLEWVRYGIERRLKTLLEHVDECVEKHGKDAVLLT